MGMQIKINDNELREITGTLSEIRQRFKTVTTDARFLRSVGQLLVSRAKQNLEDGGTPEKSYDLLKPATQRQKSRLGYSLKPLQRTGLMKRSLAHEISGGLKLTGLDIIKHHQWGGTTRRYRCPPCLHRRNARHRRHTRLFNTTF